MAMRWGHDGQAKSKTSENLTEAGTYEDGDRLRLVVKTTGRKSWLLRFQPAGRRREMGLDSYPEVSLKNARLEANAKRRHLIDGIDALAARDQERTARHEAQRSQEAKQLKFETLQKVIGSRTVVLGLNSGAKAGCAS